jgi:ionotropic glutamate receptor
MICLRFILIGSLLPVGLIGDATDIRFQVLTSCDLQMVGEEFSRKPYALAVQQGSPLKDQLNDA